MRIALCPEKILPHVCNLGLLLLAGEIFKELAASVLTLCKIEHRKVYLMFLGYRSACGGCIIYCYFLVRLVLLSLCLACYCIILRMVLVGGIHCM